MVTMTMKLPLPLLLLVSIIISPAFASTFDDDKGYYSQDPHSHHPSKGSPPSRSSGGSYGSPPSQSSGGGYGSSSPPTKCGRTPSPSRARSGSNNQPPSSTPVTYAPPVTTPTPSISSPTPPVAGPNSPGPFPCIFWRNHPTMVWNIVGWLGTLGNVFGIPSIPGFGPRPNVMQALSNPRTDGFGELYREGTAALLNSMVHAKFPYTTSQVRERFIAALGSNEAAAAQARAFKMANEGRTGV